MRTFSISGGLAGPPSACSSDPDRVDVFAVGSDDTVWRWSLVGANWQLAPEPLPPNGTIPRRRRVRHLLGARTRRGFCRRVWLPSPGVVARERSNIHALEADLDFGDRYVHTVSAGCCRRRFPE